MLDRQWLKDTIELLAAHRLIVLSIAPPDDEITATVREIYMELGPVARDAKPTILAEEP